VDFNQNLRCSSTATSTSMTPPVVATQSSSTFSSSVSPSSTSSASPLPSPASSSSSLPSATLISNQPSATSALGDANRLDALYQCSPCGQSTCTFTGDGNPADPAIYNITVGTPVSNCEGNGSDISESVGGSVTIGQAWSTDDSIGFSLGPLHIGGGGGWTESSSITYDQSVSITVSHGYMGILVAIVQYKRTNGSVQIDNEALFTVFSNQPVTILSYTPDTVPCNSQFDANISSTFNCTSASNPDAGMRLEVDTQLTTLVPTIAVLLVSIYLLA